MEIEDRLLCPFSCVFSLTSKFILKCLNVQLVRSFCLDVTKHWTREKRDSLGNWQQDYCFGDSLLLVALLLLTRSSLELNKERATFPQHAFVCTKAVAIAYMKCFRIYSLVYHRIVCHSQLQDFLLGSYTEPKYENWGIA